MPILEILICTLQEREAQFVLLLEKLKSQIAILDLTNSVKISVLSDNREMPVGEKREMLMQAATGEYVCFIDDDDSVHSDYLKLIMEALKEKPDCVGITGKITINGGRPQLFIHSNRYKTFFDMNGIFYRPPNHLNPIKTSIAKMFNFTNKNFGEDAEWAMKIVRSGLLKKEIFIREPIYFYNFDIHKSATARRK